MIPRWSFWLLAALLVLSFSDPCLGGEKKIKIGLFAPLSGPQENSGRALLDGATLAMEQINRQGGIRGIKFKLVVKDDAAPSAGGEKILSDLAVKERCIAAIGSPHTPQVLANMAIANEKGIPLIVPNWSNEITRRGNRWVFRVGAYDQLLAGCLATFAVQELKWKRIALLYENEEPGQEGMKSFSRAARRLGVHPIGIAPYFRGDRDFTIQVSQIIKKGPDGVVLWGRSTEAAYLAQQLRQMGYRGAIMGPTDLGDPQFIEIAGAAGNDAIFPTPLPSVSRNPVVMKFQEDFKDRFHYLPSSDYTASGYDAVLLLARALQGIKWVVDRRAIREALSEIDRYELVQGLYSFKGSNGNGLGSLPLLTYLNRQPVLLHDQYRPDPRTLSP